MPFNPKNHTQAPFKKQLSSAAFRGTSLAEGIDRDQALIIQGQGVISVQLCEQPQNASITVSTVDLEPESGFKLEVGNGKVTFYEITAGQECPFLEVNDPNVGLDPDPTCQYWFSIDSQNRKLRFGKGEIRLETQCAEATIPGPVGQRAEPYGWIFHLSTVVFETIASATLWRDPVAAPLPLIAIPSDAMTMDDASLYLATVPANLSRECQQLYSNICGANFKLNTHEFPDFTEAIEASIHDPNGWCYKKLAEKASEFGDPPSPKSTYLRITMGCNQGESPGIPYVLEIWPPDHYSPIHNHAGANAIIRVLHGEITVSLYSMLSIDHQTPFATQKFGEGCITWISPQLNQTHKLHNTQVNGPTCMTIQCYGYALEDNYHYEYFNYIDNSGMRINSFDPNSDMDFVQFKALMKQERAALKLANLR